MYYDKQKVIDWAWSQVGYHEGENNWNKYAEIMDKVKDFYNGIKQNQPYCDIWVDCGFYVCYGREGALYLLCQPEKSCGAGCSFSAQYYNAKGQFYKSNPQTGDQIFFGSAWNNIWHTGLVVEVQASRVVTIEGNTSDQVAPRSYALNDSSIWGYGRPKWGTPENSSETPNTSPEKPVENEPQHPDESSGPVLDCTVKLPTLKNGSKNVYVKLLQRQLIAMGYDCGNKKLLGVEKPDGEFGPMTAKAVKTEQKKNGLQQDGEVGEKTWPVILAY